MKKVIALICLFLAGTPFALAEEVANIKIKIAGAVHDNSYFLCIPDIGCLSLLAAKNGKVFPIIRPIEMNTIFVVNERTAQEYNQGLPASCNVKVEPSHSITIYGTLEARGQGVEVKGLRCVVS
jgi:hypothetical protein